jgi:hypothetical protein
MSLTQENNYAQAFRFNPHIVVSFFNELATKRKTMCKASISFFNDPSIEKRNYACRLSVIMASKRITLWKDTMSRDNNRSWLPRDLYWMEEHYSRRNTCRGS